MYRRDVQLADSGNVSIKPMEEGFWNKPPEWWETVAVIEEKVSDDKKKTDEEKKEKEKAPAKEKKVRDWIFCLLFFFRVCD
jgi:hypothetical protein